MAAQVWIDGVCTLSWPLAASTAGAEVMDQRPPSCRLDEAWLRSRAQESCPTLCHAQGLLTAANKKLCLK